jgi:oligopeptide transport system substrate-binding protein
LEPLKLIESYLDKKVHWSLAYIPVQLLSKESDLHMASEYSTGFYYFSNSKGPYAKDSIRKALVKLIPWDQIRRESGQIFPTDRLIPDSLSFEFIDEVDEAGSYKILSDEGFPYGAGLPDLNMAVHRGAKIFESAQKIADIWSQKLGITVILDVVPLGMYSRYPSQSPYDFAFITWIGDILDPFAFLNLFNGSSGYNLANYNDNAYDRLLSTAMTSEDEQQREVLIEKAHRYLLDEAVVIPIYHGITTNIVSTDIVKGWYDNILNIHPLKNLEVLNLK